MARGIKIFLLISFSLFCIIPALSHTNNDISDNTSVEVLDNFWLPYNIDVLIKKISNVQNNNISNNIIMDTAFQKVNAPLEIQTYDGSGQLTHPSVLYFPEGWNNHKYWAAATPYPNSDDRYENPSIYYFDTPGENWKVPANLVNPVVPQPSMGFNADPCLAYNKTSNELYCFYREYNSTDLNFSYYIIKSSDDVSWSSPILLYNITSNKPILCDHMSTLKLICLEVYIGLYDFVNYDITNEKRLEGGTNNENSNSIVQLPNGTWMMWAQKWDSAYSIVYRTSTDCLHWSEPKSCNFVDGFSDRTVWHIDVKYIPEYERFLMIQYSNVRNCLTLAESRDGINWKYYSKSILKPDDKNSTNFANSQLYKSSFTYDPLTDTIHLWYAGVSTENEWKVGYTNISYSELRDFVYEQQPKNN